MVTNDLRPDLERDQDNPLVQAALAESEFAAQTKAAVLQDEGIEAFVFPAERSWTGGLAIAPSGGGVPVWVRKSDLERAKGALTRVIADSVDLNWDEVDVGEPEHEVNSSRTPKVLLQVIVVLGAIIAVAGLLAMFGMFGESLRW